LRTGRGGSHERDPQLSSARRDGGRRSHYQRLEAPAAVASGNVAYGALLGNVDQGPFCGGWNLIIGICTNAVLTHRGLRDRAANVAYRHLALPEQNSVVFRGAETAGGAQDDITRSRLA
jgi:hypothetical protein